MFDHINPNKNIFNEPFESRPQVADSNERQKAMKQIGGRIVQENEIKLFEALEENQALKHLYEQRCVELDRLNYK